MRPTEILSAEHRVIEQVLDCVEAIAEGARSEGSLDQDSAAKALEVLSTFADRCHHGKEEERLFPALERLGLSRHVGPVAVMLHEHELGRAAIGRMRSGLAAAAAGDANAPEEFARAARAYVDLLREHIAKEDSVLFPLAESLLRDEDRQRLLAEFARMEADEMGPGTHERMLALADELALRFGVVQAADRSGLHAGAGCCHSRCS